MSDQFLGVNASPRQQSIPASKDTGIRPNWRMNVVGLIGLFSLGLTALMGGILTVARAEPIPRILELPQRYLPGNLPPENMSCDNANTSGVPRCFVWFQDNLVEFDFDIGPRIIRSAFVRVDAYTLGQLILSWGTPTGVNRNHYTNYIYWPSRWVILDNDSFGPSSQVKSILYNYDQPMASPWRGFTRNTD